MRCRKHEPEPRTGGNLLDDLAGRVRCKNCGRLGAYSNGQRKFGRPRRIIWFREEQPTAEQPPAG
jgi:hypothetical protein